MRDLDLGYNLVKTHDGASAFLVVDHDEEDLLSARAPIGNIYAPGAPRPPAPARPACFRLCVVKPLVALVEFGAGARLLTRSKRAGCVKVMSMVGIGRVGHSGRARVLPVTAHGRQAYAGRAPWQLPVLQLTRCLGRARRLQQHAVHAEHDAELPAQLHHRRAARARPAGPCRAGESHQR